MSLHIKPYRNKYTYLDISTDKETEYIVFLGDVHLGARNFNEKVFNNVLKFCKEKNAIIFLIGDLIENSNKISIGAGWVEQTMTPQKQIECCTDLLKPLSKQIAGSIIGNHEERTYKNTGVNPTEIIAYNLGIEYCKDEFFGSISRQQKSGSCAFSFYGSHSMSGHKNSGLAANAVMRDWSFMRADIIAKAHGHDRDFLDNDYMEIDKLNKGVAMHRQWILLTGHYLDREDSYNSRKPSKPKALGTIALKLTLDRNGRKIEPVYLD